jgi:hypothetical protein
MKKLLIAVFVVAITGVAVAETRIAVNGIVDNNPEASFIYTNQPVDIGIWSDGDTPLGEYFIGIGYGEVIYVIGSYFSSLDISQANRSGYVTDIYWNNEPAMASYFQVKNPFIMIWADAPSGPGMLVDNINFSLSSEYELGCVVLGYLPNSDDYQSGIILDTKGLRPIPEPITIVLLGLGGMMLRRHR